jgi:hypothetical protein
MADKNITQVDGGEITDPASGIIYIGTPSAGPYGYDDAFITTENFKASLQSQITTNASNISTNSSDISDLQDITSVVYHKDKNSAFSFSVAQYEILEEMAFIYKAGTPTIKVGTTLGGEELIPEFEIDSDSEPFRLDKLFTAAGTVYVSVTGGTISLARFMKQLDSSEI